jgi:chromosome segregation ATPase
MESTERIIKLETDVDTIKGDLKVVDTKLTRHEEEIDSLSKQQEKLSANLAIVRKDIESIDGGVKRVEATVNKSLDKLDKLQEHRINDHYTEPLKNYKNLVWKILGVIIGILVTFVMGALFPMLVNK